MLYCPRMDPVTPDFPPPRRRACAIFGWLVFALLAVGILWFGSKVWFYYDKIQSGDISALPQFTARLTASGSAPGAAVSGTDSVSRQDLEKPGAPSLGPEGAELTIVEFADFECPYSKEAAAAVRTASAKYGDRVRVIYRHYPIESIHSSAMLSAQASECAAEQGKFWAYHDKLYLEAPALRLSDLVVYAVETGMDSRQFEKCLLDERYKMKVEEDVALARKAVLRGTPTFFFNGSRVDGAIPTEALDKVIGRLLQQK